MEAERGDKADMEDLKAQISMLSVELQRSEEEKTKMCASKDVQLEAMESKLAELQRIKMETEQSAPSRSEAKGFMTTAGGPEENCHRRRVALREDLLKAYDELDKEGTEIVPRLDLGKSIEAFVPRCPDLDVQDLSDMVRTLSSIVVEKDEYAGIVDRWVEHNNSKDAVGPSAPPAVGPPSPPAGPLSPSKKEAVDWLAGPSASPAPAPSPVPAAKLRGKGPAPGAQRLSSSTTATSPPTTLRGKAPPPEKVETSGRPRGPSAGGPGSPPVSPPSDVQKVSGASMSDFARSP